MGKLIKFYAEEKHSLTEDQILEFTFQIAKGLDKHFSIYDNWAV